LTMAAADKTVADILDSRTSKNDRIVSSYRRKIMLDSPG